MDREGREDRKEGEEGGEEAGELRVLQPHKTNGISGNT